MGYTAQLLCLVSQPPSSSFTNRKLFYFTQHFQPSASCLTHINTLNKPVTPSFKLAGLFKSAGIFKTRQQGG